MCDSCTDNTQTVAKRYTKKVLTTHFNNVLKHETMEQTMQRMTSLFSDADNSWGTSFLQFVQHVETDTLGSSTNTFFKSLESASCLVLGISEDSF